MKKSIYYLCLLFILNSPTLFAQPLIEKIGGIETQLSVLSDSIILNDTEQFLIKKSTIISDPPCEIIHHYALEFLSEADILIKKPRRLSNNKMVSNGYVLTLFNEQEELIGELKLGKSNVCKNLISASNKFVYEINLIEVPISLLRHVSKMNIIRYSYWHRLN